MQWNKSTGSQVWEEFIKIVTAMVTVLGVEANIYSLGKKKKCYLIEELNSWDLFIF